MGLQVVKAALKHLQDRIGMLPKMQLYNAYGFLADQYAKCMALQQGSLSAGHGLTTLNRTP